MENNLLFSAQKAEELNALAQKIDGRLQLFAGYEPMHHFSHPEAGFLLSCLNLYKCTVDSMILWRKLDKVPYRTYLPADGLRILADLDTMQDVLRSTIAHNNSAMNGDIQYQRIQNYEHWIHKVTGNPVLGTEASYSLALKAVLDMGTQLFQVLEQFLKKAAQASDSNKSKLIERWIDDAAHWYSSKKYNEIYLGRLNQHIRGRQDVTVRTHEELMTTRRILIRNAMKRQADEEYFKHVGYRTNAECMQKLIALTKTRDVCIAKDQMLRDAAHAEENRQDYYKWIDDLGCRYNKARGMMVERFNGNELESAWQDTLKAQLVECAAQVSSLSPDVWLDEHVYMQMGILSATPVTYSAFKWLPIHGK